MLCSWISRILFCILSHFVNCQSRGWTSGGNGFEYFASNTTVQSYDDGEKLCATMGGFLAQSRGIERERILGGLIRGHPSVKNFFIGLTANLVWNDCTMPSQRILKELSLHDGKLCTTLNINETDCVTQKFHICDSPAGFICQRRRGYFKAGSEIKSTPCCVSRRMNPDVLDSPTFNNATTNIDVAESSLDFSLDLVSFLIGLAIPCPFLLASVIKIICSAKCQHRKRKKKTVKQPVSSVTTTSCYSRRSVDFSNTMDTDYEPVYDTPCENSQFGRSIQPLNGYQVDGYERPIMSSQSSYHVEPATYEEYDFSRVQANRY